MNEDTFDIIRRKLEFFKDQDLAVHVTKKNSWFSNGKILDIRSDFFMIHDEVEGEMPIFFLEVQEIERRNVKRDDISNP